MARKRGAKRMKRDKSYVRQAKLASQQREQPIRKPIIKKLLNPIIISVIIVYILVVIVYFLNYTPKKLQQESLERDKAVLAESLNLPQVDIDASSVADQQRNIVTFIIGEEIDKQKLREFALRNYNDIKKELGLKNEFCIHFEDQAGNLIDISGITDRPGIGIGSPELEFTLTDDEGNPVGVVTC